MSQFSGNKSTVNYHIFSLINSKPFYWLGSKAAIYKIILFFVYSYSNWITNCYLVSCFHVDTDVNILNFEHGGVAWLA